MRHYKVFFFGNVEYFYFFILFALSGSTVLGKILEHVDVLISFEGEIYIFSEFTNLHLGHVRLFSCSNLITGQKNLVIISK